MRRRAKIGSLQAADGSNRYSAKESIPAVQCFQDRGHAVRPLTPGVFRHQQALQSGLVGSLGEKPGKARGKEDQADNYRSLNHGFSLVGMKVVTHTAEPGRCFGGPGTRLLREFPACCILVPWAADPRPTSSAFPQRRPL